jgi:hypothetical protein
MQLDQHGQNYRHPQRSGPVYRWREERGDDRYRTAAVTGAPGVDLQVLTNAMLEWRRLSSDEVVEVVEVAEFRPGFDRLNADGARSHAERLPFLPVRRRS